MLSVLAFGCAAVDSGRKHLSVRRQTARAARASRRSIENSVTYEEEALRRRAHAISRNRIAATRKDEEFEVNRIGEHVKGDRRLEGMDSSCSPSGYVRACERGNSRSRVGS